ncbi:hypothetical protein JHK82_034023 [Glycine max]|nr:hypothetical protein JHK86_034094 [Glycine max]KAG5119603.1 hypothetical protein JHK82_034023 [Glycine max]KAG5140593.1 hypothetical protein JHK84_034361 [Glycine max]
MQQQWVDIIGNIKEQALAARLSTKGSNVETADVDPSGDKNVTFKPTMGFRVKHGVDNYTTLPRPIDSDQELRVGMMFDLYKKVECKEFFYRHLPELDDSIADKLLLGCTTAEQKCQEVEQTAREQVTDNAILDQISKTVQVDIPQSLFEEQGRQLYGANLLEIQVLVASCIIFRPIRQHKFQHV